MPNPTLSERILNRHMSDGRPAYVGDLLDWGISKPTLIRLVRKGTLVRLDKGIYTLDIGRTDRLTLAAMVYGGTPEVPKGVICLQMAAYIHGLTDMGLMNIEKTEIVLPFTATSRAPEGRRVRILQFRNPYMPEDIEWHEFGGHGIHVTTPARTVCDLYAKFAGNLPEGMASEALARLSNIDFKQAEKAANRARELGWGDRIKAELAVINNYVRYHEFEPKDDELSRGLSL